MSRVRASRAGPGSPQALTGTRIRERRLALGLKQASLAREVGISAAYLNLIEHNRRPAPAELLADLAEILSTDTASLAEGGEDALFEALRAAAGPENDDQSSQAELDRIDEFVSRFPGWAGLLAARQTRVAQLERTVIGLTERVAHDPYLANTLHEVLSAVTSLRSTAAILTEEGDLAAEWRERFHQTLREDSRRAAETAEALAAYLDRIEDDAPGVETPLDEVEGWLAEQGWAVPEAGDDTETLRRAPQLVSTPGRKLAGKWLERLREDARRLPEGDLRAALGAGTDVPEPLELARQLDRPLGLVLRRLGLLLPEAGLVLCDGAGALVLRRAAAGFSLPRLGGACPLWPLYSALSQPGRAIHRLVEMPGRASARFATYAYCEPHFPEGFAGPALSEAAMLILPARGAEAYLAVGPGCRTCPRRDCAARREPSILAAEPRADGHVGQIP